MTELEVLAKECEQDLKTYAKWVLPERYFGDLHWDMFDFIQYGDEDSKLILVPRDHQKSICIAIAASWFITKDPSVTINYVSYNSDLVVKQINFIKSILKSERHKALWPTILNWVTERGTAKHKPTGMWQQDQFRVDHPKAKQGADPTVRGGTVRGTNTGMHSKINIFDDLVTDENWKTETNKAETLACYENFSKILSPGGKTYAVGTRYDPSDLYSHLKEEEAVWIDPETREEKREILWTIFERVIEDSLNRDGTGNYAWPRQVMEDGKTAYGFDARERAIKFEKLSKSGLANAYAQYYNDPNDDSTNVLNRNSFNYLDPKHLKQGASGWEYKGDPLRIYAYADLAFTDKSSKNARRRDYTAIAVTGINHEGYIFVLELRRFQTDKNEVYYDEIIDLHEFWGFKSITVESNNAGKFIKKYLQDEVRRQGGHLTVEGKPHVSHEGSKLERIEHTLMPRYKNETILHNKGGYTKQLEDELVLSRPAHDDLKDALAGAVNLCVAPVRLKKNTSTKGQVIPAASRFGGRRRSRRA